MGFNIQTSKTFGWRLRGFRLSLQTSRREKREKSSQNLWRSLTDRLASCLEHTSKFLSEYLNTQLLSEQFDRRLPKDEQNRGLYFYQDPLDEVKSDQNLLSRITTRGENWITVTKQLLNSSLLSGKTDEQALT